MDKELLELFEKEAKRLDKESAAILQELRKQDPEKAKTVEKVMDALRLSHHAAINRVKAKSTNSQ